MPNMTVEERRVFLKDAMIALMASAYAGKGKPGQNWAPYDTVAGSCAEAASVLLQTFEREFPRDSPNLVG